VCSSVVICCASVIVRCSSLCLCAFSYVLMFFNVCCSSIRVSVFMCIMVLSRVWFKVSMCVRFISCVLHSCSCSCYGMFRSRGVLCFSDGSMFIQCYVRVYFFIVCVCVLFRLYVCYQCYGVYSYAVKFTSLCVHIYRVLSLVRACHVMLRCACNVCLCVCFSVMDMVQCFMCACVRHAMINMFQSCVLHSMVLCSSIVCSLISVIYVHVCSVVRAFQ